MPDSVRLGLRENVRQFVLLVIVNAFVGGMAGLERSILPRIAEEEFGMSVKTVILSFIIVFGVVKAITNYYTGKLAARFGRRTLLIAGWIAAMPIPFIFMYAPSWNWIVAANILLGVHQGLAWSSTVMMKIDLVGEKQRGFAMGLNEFAGYLAVAMVALATGWIAGRYGLRPYPFIIGVVFSFAGLLLTLFWVKDTVHHLRLESSESEKPRLQKIFRETSLTNRNLGAITQAGLVNNLNDGMVWGLLPLLLSASGFSITRIGVIAAIYPAVWGAGQLITGKMADAFPKKALMFWGMFLQALALGGIALSSSYAAFVFLSALLGWGTAMVYPTFLAAISEHTHPLDRAEALGVFRFWRDMGYAIGALMTGLIADMFDIPVAIFVVAGMTLFSALFVQFRMQ